MPDIFIVIQCGYEGIEKLIYGSVNSIDCINKINSIKSELSILKEKMNNVGEKKWEQMLSDKVITYDEYQKALYLDPDSLCLQKFDGEFNCCCAEYKIETSKSWIM